MGISALAFCLYAAVSGWHPSPFGVFYNLPIALIFGGAASAMVCEAIQAGLRRYARRRWLLLTAWAAGFVVLYLRLIAQSIPASGHVVWCLLMAAQASAAGWPRSFQATVASVLVQVLLLKFAYWGGTSGVWGLAVGTPIAMAAWVGARSPPSR